MKLGCCVNMLANETDPTGSRWIPLLAKSGYDYVELPLAQVMDLDEASFAALEHSLKENGIPCECCNNFFPASVRLTGPAVDGERTLDYARRALDRAHRLGAEVVVFGSSGAKNVPIGFDHGKAFDQVVGALQSIGELAARRDITIAIEPLNRTESNLICSTREGLALMRAVGHPSIRLLVDYYHFSLERESEQDLLDCAPDLVHSHFADPQGRTFPAALQGEYQIFYQTLQGQGYQGRVSAEAYSENPQQEIPAFLQIFSTPPWK